MAKKADLPTTLLSNKIINTTSTVDTVYIPIDMYENMSIEIKAKVVSSEGRGLDVDLRKKDLTGFRTSLNTEKLQWSAPLSSSYLMNFSSTEEQTIRYAVEGNMVHIYQNGSYIDSKNLTTFNNIVDGVEETDPDFSEGITGSNIAENIFGNLTTETPLDAGWKNNGAGTVPWNTPNTNSGVRFTNTLNNRFTYNGQTYSENNHFMLMRWESGVTNGSSYYYPLTLEANKTYNLSSLYTYWGNGSSGTFKIGVSKETTGINIINQSEITISNGNAKELYDNNLTFSTTDAGTYYLLVENDGAGIWFLGDIKLYEFEAESRIIVGKNYLDGSANMQITSVTFDDTGSFAPVSSGNFPKNPVNINNENYSIGRFINAEVTVSGKSEIHITEIDPLRNSAINLTSDDSWLYLERIKPSKFLDDSNPWLDAVKINGQKFDINKDRIGIYASGCVIIPNGKLATQEALTIYTEENFGGNFKKLEVETYHNNLDTYDNNVKSFKLKKGFAVTFANNKDGTGFSKMFIASDEDLEIPVLPEGFIATATDKSSFISFIRVFKWHWNSKKGLANKLGGDANYQASPSIYYNWSAGGDTENVDVTYVPMRHNLGWDSFTKINSSTNVTHVLGYNEPARPDQADMSVESAINQWPEFFKSGLRIGSPAPAAIGSSWLSEFMKICDELNYRVDFVAFHAYQDQPTSWWSWNISTAAIGGRPVWITEWNNGANWTNGADAAKWPDISGLRFYPNGDPILDENGVQKTGSLPLTAANAERNKIKLEQILSYFETNDLVEHHFLYQWVNDARSLELGGQITPAGEMFGEFNSSKGFKKSKEYNHTWKIAPAWLEQSLSNDFSKSVISWYDHNGETGKNYTLERKINDETNFTPIATLVLGEDYEAGKTISFEDEFTYDIAKYRVRAVSYKDSQSIYSREITITRDQPAAAPNLTAKALSGTVIELDWNNAANASLYNIKRSNTVDGEFELIAENISEITFRDTNLDANTTYFYKVVGVNSFGEGNSSNTVSVTTLGISAPEQIDNIYISSGDGSNIITWNFVFDTYYTIYRATSPNDTFSEIESNFEGVKYVDNSNIVNGTTYYYKVVPKNTEGTGPESDVLVATPKKGQHAKFTFNENVGVVAYDEWGGYHGELKNNANWSIGSEGSAVSLSATDESYIQVGNNIMSNLNDFSISTWFKTPAVNNDFLRLFDFGGGTGNFMLLIPKANDTQSRFIIDPINGTRYNVYMTCDFPVDEWVHVALTLEGSTLKYYINGELVFTDTNCTLTPADVGDTNQNYLGKSQYSNDLYTDYSYDSFEIYNYALVDSDVIKLSKRETLLIENIKDFNNLNVRVYPNPIERGQRINIDLSSKYNVDMKGTINVYNLLGALVSSNKIQKNVMTIKAPSKSNIYIVEIRTATITKQLKIIVK
ncbi:hypothetical protein BW723_06265 [Polaribacter reichenbachii]|uniref:Fibronectin type-III domain-containing protein n=1 Tax=Polaribacter reichenbachii TaxID=996801 RepID=A0A1B8U666_9FLAO|nr:hypothetical protein BW723_06265 [Polaribacter reichenbachii]AUC19783.1 hypothetical protein BTO17_14285 [Polaribacter reichenbachii]OBY67364.1 hypothetical protein LPB301_03225 [Polaribacter reichenbachii]